jgi:hypothetical protein
MNRSSALLAFLLLLTAPASTSATSVDTDILRGLKGYTILSVSSIEGEFEGCDYDKKIVLEDGSVFTCAEYNYMYSYHPDVVVFGKALTYQGRTFIDYKLLIEDEIFEMRPKVGKE